MCEKKIGLYTPKKINIEINFFIYVHKVKYFRKLILNSKINPTLRRIIFFLLNEPNNIFLHHHQATS